MGAKNPTEIRIELMQIINIKQQSTDCQIEQCNNTERQDLWLLELKFNVIQYALSLQLYQNILICN